MITTKSLQCLLQTANVRHDTVICVILLTVNQKKNRKDKNELPGTHDYIKLLSIHYYRTQNTEYII